MDKEKLLKTFSKNLKSIMREMFMTQEELARDIDISRITVARYTSGQYLPNLHTAMLICRALQCSLNDLFGEEY